MAADIGRNEPCPCGSGLKYKKCCGSVLREANRGEAASKGLPPNQTNATLPSMGLPGQHQQIHIVNQFKGDDPRNHAPLGGSPGEYEVTFILGRPGFSLLPEGQISFANGLKGTSHLAITRPAFTPPDPNATMIRIYAQTEDGTFAFTGFPDEKGFLGKIVSVSIQAQNRNDAEHKAYRAVAPALSNWSAHLDIPLEIVQRETKEFATGNIQTSVVVPYSEAPFAVTPTHQPTNEFRGYTSLYREALGSSSSVYSFVCFYKIIEGLRARRVRLERASRRSGVPQAAAPAELLPATASEVVRWLNAIFPVHREWDAMCIETAVPPIVRGQAVQDFVAGTLKPLRDNITHALTEISGELTVSADELLDINQVAQWLFLTKCIVRRMLKNDFPVEFLSYLGEDGVVRA